MLSKEEFEILDVFRQNMFSQLSIAEIIKGSEKASKPWVFNVLKKLEKQDLIIKERKANINLYKANLDNILLINRFLFLDTLSLTGFKHMELINRVINNSPVKNYCLIVFGSYAGNKVRKKSDLDLCFLIGEKAQKELKPVVEDIKLKSLVEIDDHYILLSDFVKMLLAKEENLGKQVYRHHKLFFNGSIYYELVKEAHKHGFQG